MRIITGSAKGRKLKTADGLDIRPTTDRVKEGLFSIIQFDVPNSNVLDLFAGSGQLGLEAASRGASSVCLVDKSAKALKVIHENIKSLDLDDICEVFSIDSLSFLQTTGRKFDIVFVDPPYNGELFEKVLKLLPDIITESGMVLCEHDCRYDIPHCFGKLNLKNQYRYGKTKISLFRLEE